MLNIQDILCIFNLLILNVTLSLIVLWNLMIFSWALCSPFWNDWPKICSLFWWSTSFSYGPQSHGTLVTLLTAIRKIPVIWYDPLNSPLLFLLLIYTSWSRTTWVLKLSPFSIIKSQKMIIYTHRRYEINSHIHMYHYIQIRSVKFWVLSYSPVM